MKKIKKIAVLLCISTALILSSCKKDDDEKTSSTDRKGGFFIVNEGGFNKGNATLGFVSASGTYETPVFETANNRKLGDVFQSIYETDNHYFLVVNNSAKIEVLNKTTLKSEKTMENMGSPRYMVMSGGVGFVNDLFAPKLTYFDVASPETISTMNLNGTAKSIAVASGFVYCVVNGKLVTIDTKAMQQKNDSSNYGLNLVTAMTNGNDEIYALAKGEMDSLFALKINAVDKSLMNKLFIETNTSWLSAFNYSKVNGEFSFYDKGAIYTIPTAGFDKVNKITTPASATYVYNYSIHPSTGEYYICDAKDFTQNGEVIKMDKSGNELEKYTVGISPNSCFFVND